jgi:hypothetical protein
MCYIKKTEELIDYSEEVYCQLLQKKQQLESLLIMDSQNLLENKDLFVLLDSIADELVTSEGKILTLLHHQSEILNTQNFLPSIVPVRTCIDRSQEALREEVMTM